MSIVISQAAGFCIFKDDFQNALRKTKCFSFVDLLYLAAEIDKHGLQNVFLPIFLLSLCTLNFPFPFLSLSPSFFSARPCFKYTSKIPQVLVSDNICHSSYLRSDLLFFKMTTDLFLDTFSVNSEQQLFNHIFQC